MPDAPPKQPQVSEVDYESCRVTGQAPAWDGGSDVISYVIEKRDVTSDSGWLKAASTSGVTSLVVRRLNEGTEYRCTLISFDLS